MSKRTVELCEFERREGRHEMSQFTLEHQGEEIAADRAGPWQAVFWSEHHFCAEAENGAVNRGADHSGDIFVLCDKGAGYNDVKAWLCSTFGNPFAGSVDLASPHERACSDISTRAWRARCFRCFRKIAPSLASLARRRSLSAYWRRAVRTSAARLRRRDDVSVSSSRSFEVASSIAILFIRRIISGVLDYAQGLHSVLAARADKAIRR